MQVFGHVLVQLDESLAFPANARTRRFIVARIVAIEVNKHS